VVHRLEINIEKKERKRRRKKKEERNRGKKGEESHAYRASLLPVGTTLPLRAPTPREVRCSAMKNASSLLPYCESRGLTRFFLPAAAARLNEEIE